MLWDICLGCYCTEHGIGFRACQVLFFAKTSVFKATLALGMESRNSRIHLQHLFPGFQQKQKQNNTNMNHYVEMYHQFVRITHSILLQKSTTLKM